MWKRLLIIFSVIVLLLIIALALLPFIIDVDRFRPEIETRLSAALGRRVTIGHLELDAFRGDLKAADISISDDPRFSSEPFLRAKTFAVGVELGPLIRSRELQIRSLVFQEPEVVLLRDPSGQWNFSSMGAGKGEPDGATARMAPAVPARSLKITDGRLSIGSPGKKLQQFEDVNLTAENVGREASFPLTLAARTASGGTLDIQGNAGPFHAEDAAKTPFDAQVTLRRVDLGSLLDPTSGIAGVIDYEGTLRSDGTMARSEGTATVEKLRVVKTGTPAGQPVSLKYASDYNLQTQSGKLIQQVKTGSSTVDASGNYDLRGEATVVHMKLDAPNIPVADIQALLPALGVMLPAGSSLQGGTLTAHLSLDGPASQLVASGDVNLSDSKLTGFGLASKLAALSAFAGIKASPDTMIQTMTAKLRISPDGIRMQDLNLVASGIGTLTGAGSIGANGALDFKLAVQLAQTGLGGALSQLAERAGVAGVLSKGIPILVQGTTAAPVFLPDTGALMQSTVPAPAQSTKPMTTPPKNLGDVLGEIFGGKKKQPAD